MYEMDNSIKKNIKKAARIMTSLKGTFVCVVGGLIIFMTGDLVVGGIVVVIGVVIGNHIVVCDMDDRLEAIETMLKKEYKT